MFRPPCDTVLVYQKDPCYSYELRRVLGRNALSLRYRWLTEVARRISPLSHPVSAHLGLLGVDDGRGRLDHL